MRTPTSRTLGGGEFSVLLKHCGVSIGIAVLSPGMSDAWNAVDATDQACYQAKREGKNRIRISA